MANCIIIGKHCINRIREKKRLMILESREKRRIEKPRLPRTAKKIQMKTMETELGELGVEVDAGENVGV